MEESSSCAFNEVCTDSNDLLQPSTSSQYARNTNSSTPQPLATSHETRLIQNITKYLDFNSPLIKPLIDIEKKFWTSTTNHNYKFPRRTTTPDQELSIQSLRDVQKYQLSDQNARQTNPVLTRPKEPKAIPRAQEPSPAPQKRDHSPTNPTSPRSPLQQSQSRKQQDLALAKLRAQKETSALHNQLSSGVVAIPSPIHSQTPRHPALMLRPSSKGASPPRSKSNGRRTQANQSGDTGKKSFARGSNNGTASKKANLVQQNISQNDRLIQSYLRLEKPHDEKTKNFLKRFQAMFAKKSPAPQSKSKESKRKIAGDVEARNKQNDFSSSKCLTASKQHYGFQQNPNQLSLVSHTATQNGLTTSRERLKKIGSGIISGHKKAVASRGRVADFHKQQVGFHTINGSFGVQTGGLKDLSSYLIVPPPKPVVNGTRLHGRLKASSNVFTNLKQQSNSRKKKSEDKTSQGKSALSKSRTGIGLFDRQPTSGFSAQQTQTEASAQMSKKSTSKRRVPVAERLRVSELDSHIFSRELKHKVWTRLATKHLGPGLNSSSGALVQTYLDK